MSVNETAVTRRKTIAIALAFWLIGSGTLMAQFGSTNQQFPQVVLNGGSLTSFTIHNLSTTETITVNVQLYSSAGAPMGDQLVALGPAATRTVVFGDEQAGLARGWAELTSDQPFIATEFFQLFIGSLGPRVGVLPSPPSREIRFLGFVNDQLTSGIAIHNPSRTESTEYTVSLTSMSGEAPADPRTLTLGPLESQSVFLNGLELFGPALTDFEGAVAISSATTEVSALSLTQETSGDVATVAVDTRSSVVAGPINTAVGLGALISNTEGEFNTATGADALRLNTVGNSNTAHGFQGLLSNTTGRRNTAIGSQSLRLNRNGAFNTASGAFALSLNLNGTANTATGDAALFANTSGSANVATGAGALTANTEGAENTAVGTSALNTNSVGESNTASGRSALMLNESGSSNTAAGFEALMSNTTGDNNTAIGASADVSSGGLTNATAIGANALVDASNKVRIGDSDVEVIEGEVAYTFTSDRTRKENFRPVDGEQVLGKLRGLDIPSWNYIGQDPATFRHYGPMAQDFYQAFGKDDVGTIGTSTTLNTGDLAGILLIATQALERRTEENSDLRGRVEELERLVRKLADRSGKTKLP